MRFERKKNKTNKKKFYFAKQITVTNTNKAKLISKRKKGTKSMWREMEWL